MNRKGHTPTILLFVGAVALVGVVLLGFVNFNGNYSRLSLGFDRMQDDLNFRESYIEDIFEDSVRGAILNADKDNFRVSFEEKFRESVQERDYRYDGFGNFFGKVRNREYAIVEKNGAYEISFTNLFVKSNSGKSEMTREFNALLRFDSEGIQ